MLDVTSKVYTLKELFSWSWSSLCLIYLRLFQVRGKLYDLNQEHRMRLGQKSIFHIEGIIDCILKTLDMIEN